MIINKDTYKITDAQQGVIKGSIENDQRTTYNAMYFFSLLYLFIEYGRPQDILPMGFLRPAMVVIIILSLMLIKNFKKELIEIPQIKFIIGFIILLAIYVPFARNNYFAFQTTKSMTLYIPFILCSILSINTIERLRKTITLLILLMIYVSAYSLTHGGKGSGNYFVDENDVALYINMWLPFCYFLIFTEIKKSTKYIYGFGLLFGILAVVYTGSRGGFVGLIAVGFVIWLFSPNKLISIFVIFLAALILFVFASQSYWDEMSTITDLNAGTANDRVESWKAAWRIFIDHPLGVGGNNFQVWFDKYQSDYFKRGMWGRVAHSLWFTLIPELGIVGILIYLKLLYKNIKDIFYLKNTNIEEDTESNYIYYLSLSFIASLAGYFSSGTFLSVLYYSHYWYLTAVIVATINITKKNMSSEFQHF